MTKQKLRLGLPKGSLNNPNRGNTNLLLQYAGYEPQGYEPGKESDLELRLNDDEIAPFLCRPQSAPIELELGYLDAAIIGGDWVREYLAGNVWNRKKLDTICFRKNLGYGRVEIVAVVPENSPFGSLGEFFLKVEKRPIICFTEYPNITKNSFVLNPGYMEKFWKIADLRVGRPLEPLVRARELSNDGNDLVQIIMSDGVTEGFISKGADIIIEATQTGETLRKYGLRELEELTFSYAGFYCGPTCVDWKMYKAQEIYKRLSAVKAIELYR